MAAKPTQKPIRKRGNNDYPLTGETLGLWRLEKGIGRGGMGEVYSAEYDYLHLLTLRYPPEDRPRLRHELQDLSREELARLASEMLGSPLPPDARFAVKVCNARSGTSGYRRFILEAELAQKLGDHPYVVTVHAIHAGSEGASSLPIDGGKHRDVAFMVMDLATNTYDYRKLSIPQAVHIIRAIATALDHAHKHGVVHRDLKPENFLGSIDHPLLTDFGIAKEIDHTLGLTRTGQIIGTLDYMSPEQATDAKSVDARSDIYSLGVVLYEFATGGHLPYVHLAEREACLAAIRSATNGGKWPRDHIPDFPRSLERIILKATAHDPNDRYQSMSELILDLDKLARGEWISPLGRIRPMRYVHFLGERHPRLKIGIPIALVLIVLLWLVVKLPVWLDERRRDYQRQLDRLEQMVLAIEDPQGGRQQLPLKQRESYERLRVTLASDDSNRYQPFLERLQALLQRLQESRYLNVDFTHSEAAADGGDKEQLRWAARVGDAQNWSLGEEGLIIRSPITMSLEPYGRGRIYYRINLRSADGLNITVTEVSDPRHRTVLRVEGQQLIVELQRDEQAPQELWRRRVIPGRDLDVALEVSHHGLRAWLPYPGPSYQDAGLRPDAAALVQVSLPLGAILKNFEIWPMGPE